jgi:phenylpropionate dioxygenase-like ring-hydroxylating dioxygenase large terminal subunit
MSFLDKDALAARLSDEAARETAPVAWSEPAVIPAGRYYDADFFALELEVLKGSWLFGVHGSEIPQPGSYASWNHLGQSLIFVRGERGEVRCFFNACRHRANALVSDTCGQRRNFVCPVHGWTYAMDGTLKGVRDRRDMPALNLGGHGLKEVRCENLGELHFVNLDGKAQALTADLGALAAEWMRYRPDQSSLVRRVRMMVAANYKLLQEANMEVYHVNSVHPTLVHTLLDSEAAPIELYANGHAIQAMRLRKRDFTADTINLPLAAEAADVSALAQVAVFSFPNRVCAMNAWGYPLMSYWPITPRSTEVEVCWIASAPETAQSEPMWNQIVETFNVVLNEDFIFCPGAQRNIEAGVVTGLLNNYQERIIHHAHRELDRRIGRERVAPGLRVAEPGFTAFADSA